MMGEIIFIVWRFLSSPKNLILPLRTHQHPVQWILWNL